MTIVNKKEFIIAAVIAALLALCVGLGLHFSDGQTEGMEREYETVLFDTSEPLRLDITVDEDDWAAILDNPTAEVYYPCDVVIDGETFYEVGIRPKGNTSLSSIAMDSDNNRYSFKLEFDHYIDGQNCFGLDKLVLNNSYADNTAMKEALTFDMYQFLGADASLYNYAEIYINGEYWGCYLALEAIEDSFLLRNYGTENCQLYKPDMFNMGNKDDEDSSGGFPDFGGSLEMPTPDVMPSSAELAETGASGEASAEFSSPEMPGFGGSASTLVYDDDELSSYSIIWQGAVTDSDDSDHRRVVEALKGAWSGDTEEIEACLDVDNLLKYMAVHSFVYNPDSMTGNMAHNYYLLEKNGQLNILPWDYNTAFGGMNGGDATDMVNDPIDTPFSGTTLFDVLLENEEYLAKYHEYYRQLVEQYVFGGGFDEFYTRTRAQIDELVRTDPNSQCSYEEYTAAAEMLYTTVKLRGESVLGQLNGTIPSTDDGQKADDSAFVDGSAIDISVMGSMMGGGMGNMPSFEMPDFASVELDDTASAEISTATDEITEASGEASGEMSFSDFPGFPAAATSAEPQAEEDTDSWVLIVILLGVMLLAFVGIEVYCRRLRKPHK